MSEDKMLAVLKEIARLNVEKEMLGAEIVRLRKLNTELANALRRAVNILSDQGHYGQTIDELSEPLEALEATKDE